MGKQREPLELLPGTLDLLILKVLARETMHGYGIAQRLKEKSEDVLQVGESSLYPALQRLLLNGWVDAEWGASENNRRAWSTSFGSREGTQAVSRLRNTVILRSTRSRLAE